MALCFQLERLVEEDEARAARPAWMEDAKAVEPPPPPEVVEARPEDWMHSRGRGRHELFEASLRQSQAGVGAAGWGDNSGDGVAIAPPVPAKNSRHKLLTQARILSSPSPSQR